MKITINGIDYQAAPLMLDVLEEAGDALDAFWEASKPVDEAVHAAKATDSPLRMNPRVLVSACAAAAAVLWEALKRADPDLTFEAFKKNLRLQDFQDMQLAITMLLAGGGLVAKSGEPEPRTPGSRSRKSPSASKSAR